LELPLKNSGITSSGNDVAERWKTPRRCEKCLKERLTEYMFAQPWGKDMEGHVQIKLDCLRCGFHQTSTWDGRDDLHGREEA
jgi:hypothetical protein